MSNRFIRSGLVGSHSYILCFYNEDSHSDVNILVIYFHTYLSLFCLIGKARPDDNISVAREI